MRQVRTFSAWVLCVSRWGKRRWEKRHWAKAWEVHPGTAVRKSEAVVARGRWSNGWRAWWVAVDVDGLRE